MILQVTNRTIRNWQSLKPAKAFSTLQGNRLSFDFPFIIPNKEITSPWEDRMKRIHELLRSAKLPFSAKPYAEALLQLNSLNDNYGCDDGRSIAQYFLSNAATWRGEEARECKTLLKRELDC